MVKTSIAEHPLLQEGEQADLADSYCKRTISSEETVAMNDVGESAFGEDSAFDLYGLECYLGAKLEVGNAVHGTICFADTEPRGQPIQETERAFVKLLAEWLNHELAHQRNREPRTAERAPRRVRGRRHPRPPVAAERGVRPPRPRLLEGRSRQRGRRTPGAGRRGARPDGRTGRRGAVARETGRGGRGLRARIAVGGRAGGRGDGAPRAATLELDVGAGDELLADPERLRTVFENLYANAANHGGPDVGVTVESLDPSLAAARRGSSSRTTGRGSSRTIRRSSSRRAYQPTGGYRVRVEHRVGHRRRPRLVGAGRGERFGRRVRRVQGRGVLAGRRLIPERVSSAVRRRGRGGGR